MAESNSTGDTPIWARAEPVARQPRISRQQIAAAALAIADAEGFEAVSMRRIARALGTGTMSLYRYIATRDDLLALAGDALTAEALVEGPLAAGWREALTLIARQTRAAYLRHPWSVHFILSAAAISATVTGPNGLRHVEQSLAALAGAPMDERAKLDVLFIVDDYVFGHLLRAGYARPGAQAGTAREAEPDAGWPALDGPAADAGGYAEFISAQLASGEFPHLAALAGTPGLAAPGDPAELDSRFELGLAALLDGIAARFPGSRRSGPHKADPDKTGPDKTGPDKTGPDKTERPAGA
jgi:AcrR family transcriptional regulator